MNYILYWLAYLAASAVFYVIFWKLSYPRKPAFLAYMLRGLLLALMITPWYSNSQNDQFAPALMIAALDTITLGASSALRALIPLMLSLILALIISIILYYKNRKKYINNKTLVTIINVKDQVKTNESELQN